MSSNRMPARDSCCAARDYYAKALVDSALSVVVERRQFSGRFGRRRVEVTGASPLCVGCHASVRCAVLLQRWAARFAGGLHCCTGCTGHKLAAAMA